MPAKGKKHPTPSIYPLASYDLGNASAKIKTADLATEFRSIAGRLSQSHAFGKITSPLVFTSEGETLVFGDDARDLIDGEPIAYTDMSRYTDGFYRKLFAAALWRSFQHIATEGIVYPTVACAIPVSEFADGKADQVKKTVDGAYVIDGLDGKSLYATIKPENLIILPEGAGSYFQALYAAGSELASREVAIIDIGYYTTDLTIWNRGNYVTGSAKSAKHGVRQVASAVHQHLRKQYHYEGDVWAVDSALEAGCMDIGNKCRGFADQRDDAYANLLDDILAFYRSNKGSRTPGVVILSGGGADGVYKFLPDTLRGDGWYVASNSRRANADGDYLFLEQRERAKENTNG
ncbi:MAG: ParM/StbA family protein [Chloroflexota bacterium]